MSEIDLSGTWRASVADPERRRAFTRADFDDADNPEWIDLEVPGHWRSSPAFATSDGPVLYRRRFDVDSAKAGLERFDVDSAPSEQRWWLVVDGAFYLGDVWLDGRYIGDTEGYFFPHQFEVTEQLQSDGEHLIAIEVDCSPQNDPTHKRNITGSLQHSSWLDPAWNPGGLWRPVRLESTGPLRLRHTRVRCLEANAERAVIGLRTVIDSQTPGSAVLRTTTSRSGEPDRAVDHELHHVLAAGENRVEWTITVDQPDLWWPHALGDQQTYDLAIEVFPAEGDNHRASDRRSVRTGLRSVRLDRWIMHVNGERMYLKGTNLVPTDQAMAIPTAEVIEADIAAAKDLGMDLVRVHSHIARPELYTAADDAGMLVWQDLPLQWSYARAVRRQAVRQAREAVDLLAHHPSVAIWSTHSEPLAGGLDLDGDDPGIRRQEGLRRRIGNALPSWNRSRLDPLLRRTLRTTDGTRPVVAGSGTLPHLPLLDSTDTHLSFGWEYGSVDDLARHAARWPNLVRFVSELGAQAVPSTDDFAEPRRWPNLDWDRLAAHHGLRRDLLDRIADPADFDTFAAWRDATQAHQAELLRRQIETLRLLKYRPSGGFAQFFLADAHPAISHAILDHERKPKAAYEAVKAACQPVVVVASPVRRSFSGTRTGEFDIHVVSDRREPIDEATVEACTPGGAHRRWTGSLPADSVTHIGQIAADGDVLQLMVVASDGTRLATNQYQVGL